MTKQKFPKWVEKMPKKVVVCGTTYGITYTMGRGASFNVQPPAIEVGCGEVREIVMESIIHEISEITHVELGTRFYRRVDNDHIFVMTHGRFQNHNLMLVAALRECGLLK